MNDHQILLAAVVFGIFLALCVIIGAAERYYLRNHFSDCYDKNIFKYKDESEENLVAIYIEARIHEDDLGCSYEGTEKDDMEVAALIESIEEIAQSKGYKLPSDDEIFQ